MGNNESFWKLDQVDDRTLLDSTRALLLSERGVLARLLAHLSEVEERRLHLRQATSSMFAYCLELGMSEDEAGRRLSAASVARRFPLVYELLDSGKLSLSVICKLKHYLTEENYGELLEGVSGLSYRRAEEWLAARFARPDVPSQVRRLPERRPDPGARSLDVSSPLAGKTPTPSNPPETPLPEAPPASRPQGKDRGLVEPLAEDRYKVQFTANQSLRDKLELCRKLMAHSNPSLDFAPVVERALELLLDELMKQRFAQTKQPQGKAKISKVGARPSKRISAETRRRVLERDGLGCSFVDESGRRCGEVAFLEFDHRTALGKGGSSDAANLRLLCRAHNRLHAEQDFGKHHVERSIRDRPRPKSRQ